LVGAPTIIQLMDSKLSNTDSSYQSEIALFNPIPASANHKRLVISLNSAQPGSGFARLDDFTLDRGTLREGGGDEPPGALTWSAQNVWRDPETHTPATFLKLDSFAGYVLEFPITDNFSYTASNNLTRPTGLAFMVNPLRLTGDFSGATPKSATIAGNELLFTNDLSKAPPSLNGTRLSHLTEDFEGWFVATKMLEI
jgi:hypothetical protein